MASSSSSSKKDDKKSSSSSSSTKKDDKKGSSSSSSSTKKTTTASSSSSANPYGTAPRRTTVLPRPEKQRMPAHDCPWKWKYTDYEHEKVNIFGAACWPCQGRGHYTPARYQAYNGMGS